MNIIKLNAIPSTNIFLKELAQQNSIENFTVVSAEYQTNGKGQRGNIWNVEEGKNLTFSVFVNDFDVEKYNVFVLNCLVAVSIVEVLNEYDLYHLKIKWPNDILSESKKIAGILIENLFKNSKQIEIIIGIGLNVNQENFEDLPKASSLYKLIGKKVDKEALLLKLVHQLKNNFDLLYKSGEETFWEIYHEYLFRKDIPSVFIDNLENQFQAIIKHVSRDGKLILELESEEIRSYDIKEIKLLY